LVVTSKPTPLVSCTDKKRYRKKNLKNVNERGKRGMKKQVIYFSKAHVTRDSTGAATWEISVQRAIK